MAWPTSKPDSTAFDNADDSIRDSRAEIKTMSDAVNNVVDFVDTSGIADGNVLIYDSASGTIKPGEAGATTLGTPTTIATVTSCPTTVNVTQPYTHILVNDPSGGALTINMSAMSMNDTWTVFLSQYVGGSCTRVFTHNGDSSDAAWTSGTSTISTSGECNVIKRFPNPLNQPLTSYYMTIDRTTGSRMD